MSDDLTINQIALFCHIGEYVKANRGQERRSGRAYSMEITWSRLRVILDQLSNSQPSRP
jgi:hypothetical protein